MILYFNQAADSLYLVSVLYNGGKNVDTHPEITTANLHTQHIINFSCPYCCPEILK